MSKVQSDEKSYFLDLIQRMIEYGQKNLFRGRSPSIFFTAGQEACVELGRLYERWNYTNPKKSDLGPTYFQLDKAINEAHLAIEEEEGKESMVKIIITERKWGIPIRLEHWEVAIKILNQILTSKMLEEPY